MALNPKWRSATPILKIHSDKPKPIEGTKYKALIINGYKQIVNPKTMTKVDKLVEIKNARKKVLDLSWEIKHKYNSVKKLNEVEVNKRQVKDNGMKVYLKELGYDFNK